jgi:uncharacterized SAM-binding protein YcdF (DUF218 family)
VSFRWLLWSLASPSQLLIAVTIAGALLQFVTRGTAGPPTRWARVGFTLTVTGGVGLLLFGLLPTSHYLAAALESRVPIAGQLPGNVTGIILLSGAERSAVSEAYGEPQLGAHATRYVAALRLAERYPDARLVYSGGPRTEVGRGPLGTQSAVAAEILGSMGLDPARVTFESESRDSCDHPRNVRALVQPQPGEHWVVVTSAMHMPRVMTCFEAAGWGDVIPYPTDFKVSPGWGAGTFRVADNLTLLDAAAHEWLGLVYYRLSGRTLTLLPQAAQGIAAAQFAP